jgi:hypothetical protein
MGLDPAGSPRAPLREGDEGWAGPVYLPESAPGSGGRLFFARLHGLTSTYAFREGVDSVVVHPTEAAGQLRTLLASGFQAVEWAVRERAVHAKSRTYRRDEVFPEDARSGRSSR